MPKKRHQTKYPRPQSTAPASLGASASRANPSEVQKKGVNELLANLRRTSLASSNHPASSQGAGSTACASPYVTATPSSGAGTTTLPPSLRQILQIPETPPPPPRRPTRLDANGRRLPPGPRPPRSWVEHRRNVASCATTRNQAIAHGENEEDRPDFTPLPGTYVPREGSMVDLLLKRMALDWEFQSVYNQYYFSSLHSRMRSSLISYIGAWADHGVTVSDLKVLLLPPKIDDRGRVEEGADPDVELLHALNHDLCFLDLSGSVGRSLTVKELIEVLFPSRLARSAATYDVQESWEAAEAPSLPPKMLPNLTHLSLAVYPSSSSRPSSNTSWKHLLGLASRLPTLTHLALAYWPPPSLTPNARFSTVVDGTPDGRALRYSGTGPYSHALDEDWSEAIVLLRKLSKSLYGLEHLDLTGCGAWFAALAHDEDGDRIDWEGDWGKMTSLRLRDGYGVCTDTIQIDRERRRRTVEAAELVERHIVARRRGKGRFIDVEKDEKEAHG